MSLDYSTHRLLFWESHLGFAQLLPAALSFSFVWKQRSVRHGLALSILIEAVVIKAAKIKSPCNENDSSDSHSK